MFLFDSINHTEFHLSFLCSIEVCLAKTLSIMCTIIAPGHAVI